MRTLCLALLVALGIAVVAPASAGADEPAGYQIQTDEAQGGRSGFWTSRSPAKNGAYRWRLMGIGIGVLTLTGVGMVVLIRRSRAD